MKIHNPEGEVRDLVLEMMNKISKSRGDFLDKVIFLERTIDFYLAYMFCEKEAKVIEMVELIFATSKMGWRAKKDLLISLIDKHDPEFKTEHPTYINDLNHVFSIRNKLAHQMLDTSFGGPESGVDFYKKTGRIRLLIFEKQKVEISYSEEDFVSEIKILEMLMDRFRRLLEKNHL